MRLFPKPDLTPEKRKENLEGDINRLQIKFERLTGDYSDKIGVLEAEYQKKEKQIREESWILDNILESKRNERKELTKPLKKREEDILTKEFELTERESSLKTKEEAKEQEFLKREMTIRSKEDMLEDMADDLGEARLVVSKSINESKAKEDALKEKEMQYLLKVDLFNEEQKKQNDLLDARRQDLHEVLLSLQAKEENLIAREGELAEEKLKVNSQRQALLVAQNEFSRKFGRNN